MPVIIDMPYRNGLVSQSFWFAETRIMIKMIEEGRTIQEARKECEESNAFGMPNISRIREVTQRVAKRLEGMDPALRKIYLDSDLGTQKLINLVLILRKDRLFFEFLNEVYREKSVLGQQDIQRSDINTFMNRKETESEIIAGWSEATKRRLYNTYLNFATDAGLLYHEGHEYKITVPIMDIVLERKLIADGEESLVKAITGVN